MILQGRGLEGFFLMNIFRFTKLPLGRSNAFVLQTRFQSTTPPHNSDAADTKVPEAKEETDPVVLLEEKEKQIKALQDLYRRALADAENIRQRSKREIDDTAAYSIQKFAKDLLDTSDFLSMALKSVPEAERSESSSNKALKDLYTGVQLTRNELHHIFKKYGIEESDPMGEKFDPNIHSALFQAPMAGKEPGTIFSVQKTGFKILGRVLRAAQVGVVSE